MPRNGCSVLHMTKRAGCLCWEGGFHHLSQPDDTVAMLQQAVRSSSRVLIPGALDMRVARPTARPTIAIAQAVAPHVAAVHDRERLEREREGGGALSERTGQGHHRTLFAKLFDLLVGRRHAP